MFKRNRLVINLPAPSSLANTRNLLISVDGRSSNKNMPLSQESYEFEAGIGCFVFIRVRDTDGDGSEWVYETDFLLIPGEPLPDEAGIKVDLLD